MSNHDVSNPIFNPTLRKFETTDPGHADVFNNVVKQLINNDVALDASLSEGMNILTPITGSTANAILLNIPTLTNNKKYSFKATSASTGSVTINGKAFKKLDGTQIGSGGVKANKVYDFYYDSAIDSVFILAKAEGDVTVANVLAGKIFSNSDDTGLVGTMPNRAGDTPCIASSVSGTTLKLTTSEGYRDGVDDNVTITDADFISANIVSGKNIFGLDGSATIQSLGGKRFATGVATATWPASGNNGGWITVSLPFTPSWFSAKGTVIKYDGTTVTPVYMIYSANVGYFIHASYGASDINQSVINFTQKIPIYVGDTMAQTQPANKITWFACE